MIEFYMIKKYFFSFFTISCLFSLFVSCKSMKLPSNVYTPLNYTDEDVIKTEIERIKELEKTDAIKALWRAYLLGKEDIISECNNIVLNSFNNAVENKDYTEAYRNFISLKAVNNSKDIDELKIQLDELYKEKGFNLVGVSEKAPSNVADCVKATVTVWVDKGIKITNGIGSPDVVLGSGFFIDKRGYIITNHHVIEDIVDSKSEEFSKLYIRMYPDTDVKIPAKVIGYDSVMDMALLKAEVEAPFVLSLGSSSDLEIGDKVSAIGTPIGLEGTLTSGIISANERKLLTLGNVFQIDAAVNSGNSGGPLIDEKMRVQAIVFAGMLRFQGLNFAIPVEFLKQELKFLYAGGEIQHSWMGAYGRTVKRSSKLKGVEVQYVIPGSSACMSHINENDVIYEFAWKKVDSIEDIQFVTMLYEPDTIVPVKYRTEDGEDKETLVYLDKRSDEPNNLAYKSDFVTGSFIPIFGMKIKPSSTTDRNTYVVDKIYRGGIADDTGFSENDTIVIKDIKIDTKEEFIGALLYTKKRTKGYLDIPLTLANSFDSPYYF